MYIIREITGLSMQQIGERFGGKSHSTVHHSISLIENRIAKDIAFKNQVYDIIKNIQDK
jgi:chromosomal replication initiator protein